MAKRTLHLVLAGLLGLACQAVRAGDVYVAPDGRADGDGSRQQPWDLQTALDQPASVGPGDTIWMTGGTYRGNFTSLLTGSAGAPVRLRAVPGEHVRIDTNGGPAPDGERHFRIRGEHAVYQGFEVTCSDPASRVTQTPGSWPADIDRGSISCRGSHNRFVHLVVHDLHAGFGFWSDGTGGEIYGCVIYNNGWSGPDRNHGHGIYTQNRQGTKRLADNIVFNQSAYGIHGYGSDQAYLRGFDVEGNTCFHNGRLFDAADESQPDIFFGGGTECGDIRLADNAVHSSRGDGKVAMGFLWGPANDDAVITGNTLSGAELRIVQPWSDLTVTGNTTVTDGRFARLIEGGAGNHTWDENTYHATGSEDEPFEIDYAGKTQSEWQSETGYDNGSDFHEGEPTGPQVILRSSEYEHGRAHLTVFNWDGAPAVEVDLSAVVDERHHFAIHHVFDLFGEAVLEGTYAGGTVALPMQALAPPEVVGYDVTNPAIPGPEFGVFVVTSTPEPTGLTTGLLGAGLLLRKRRSRVRTGCVRQVHGSCRQ